MTRPALALSGRQGRVYPWPPGQTDTVYPSVTAILNELAKPALRNWAAKTVAEYAVTNRDAWGELPPEDAIDLLKRSPYRHTSQRADIGTAVHHAIETWTADPDQPATIDDLNLLPYVAQAVDWMSHNVDRIVLAEQTVYNLTYQYAGSFDLIAKLKTGETAIIDWKTSKNIYPETGLQLAAYANGEFVGNLQGEQQDLPHIHKGIVVQLTANKGWTAKHTDLQPDLFKTFTALRRIHYYRTNTEQHVYTRTDKQEQT